MKKIILALAFLAICAPAQAQLGGLLNKASKAKDKVDDVKAKYDKLNISEEEERKLGSEVSRMIRSRFGVVQDEAVHKYVTLVGTALAQQTTRPNVPWQFIVLDTEGVNAFAAPGGFVHVTRGALGLIKNEAELAAVLSHEIGHVVHKHTVSAITKANAEQLVGDATLGNRGPYLNRLANMAYHAVLEGSFSRGDELESDADSVATTQKLGYAAGTLADFLTRLAERNKNQPLRNGLFASHPEMQERIDKVRQLARGKSGATVEARYKANVKYEATDITKIATINDGAAGLTGSSKESKDAKDEDKEKKEEPKKKGFGLGALKSTVAPEQQSAQVSASGGARGVGPDRAAKGGSNANPVKVAITAAELEAFKKGIA